MTTMTTTGTATVGQKLAVTGMTCGHCEMAVTAELFQLEGVTRVAVDVRNGTVIVESVEPLPRPLVAAAIDAAGYELA